MSAATDTSTGNDTRTRAHPTCFVCAPQRALGLGLRFTSGSDGSVSAEFDCLDVYEGYPGLVHGGIVSSLLDGAMTNCLFAQGEVAVTADLHVRFRHPLRLGQPALVRAWVTRACPPLFIVAAEVSQEGQTRAKAIGKFMRYAESADRSLAGDGAESGKDKNRC